MLGQQLFQAPSFLQINFCQPILHWYCVNADSPQMPALGEMIDKHANKCINFVSLKHRANMSKERKQKHHVSLNIELEISVSASETDC